MHNGSLMTIGLLDAMGHGNLGDAAIQDSVIANIKKRSPDVHLVGFSFVPEDTLKRHGIPCHPITRPADTRQRWRSSFINRRPRLQALIRAATNVIGEARFLADTHRVLDDLDILIFSGGGQLGDLWGGPWGHPYNLFKFALLTKFAGKRLYFLNVGAEALDYWLSRCFTKSALRMADYVSFRDVESQDQMQALGLTNSHAVYPDPAFALEVGGYLQKSTPSGSPLVVGINPIGFCDPRIWPQKDQSAYDRYLEKLALFSRWLLDNGYHLKFFPTSPSVDKYAIADLTKRLTEQPQPGHPNAPEHPRPDDAVRAVNCESVAGILSEISQCDYMVTSKYHGVIFSHLLQKPVIATGYHRKVNTAMEAAGQGQYSKSIENFQTGWLIDSFQSLVRNREHIRSQQVDTVTKFARLLGNQFDALFSRPH